MPIKDFFLGTELKKNNPKEQHGAIAGYIALGTVCHMIQDSFAASHSRRAYDLCYQEYDVLLMGEASKRTSSIQQNLTSNYDEENRQRNFREYLKKNVMPILLFADYKEQDAKLHAKADVWCTSVDCSIKSLDDLYKTTRNACYARDCTAAFLYLALHNKENSNINVNVLVNNIFCIKNSL